MNWSRMFCCAAVIVVAFGTPALAQSSAPPAPPDNGKKLSEIVAGIEARDKFRYIDEVEWNDSGYYDVTYFTTDKAKVELKIDPVSGQPK